MKKILLGLGTTGLITAPLLTAACGWESVSKGTKGDFFELLNSSKLLQVEDVSKIKDIDKTPFGFYEYGPNEYGNYDKEVVNNGLNDPIVVIKQEVIDAFKNVEIKRYETDNGNLFTLSGDSKVGVTKGGFADMESVFHLFRFWRGSTYQKLENLETPFRSRFPQIKSWDFKWLVNEHSTTVNDVKVKAEVWAERLSWNDTYTQTPANYHGHYEIIGWIV